MLIQSKPMIKMKEPNEEWRYPFFVTAEHKIFDKFILACVIINSIILAISWYEQPARFDEVTETINYVFAVVFFLEAAIKIIAYGARYFKDGWNNFDLLIVLITLISIILGLHTSVTVGPSVTVIRAFRIGRVFKLFRKNKSLKIIF